MPRDEPRQPVGKRKPELRVSLALSRPEGAPERAAVSKVQYPLSDFRRFSTLLTRVIRPHFLRYRLLQFLPERLLPKTPSPPNLSEGFRIIQTPPLLHHPFKPFPPGVAVLGNAHFAQHSIHPQPAHSLSGRFQILPKTASRMLAQRLCRFQQLGPCRIQMNIFADRAQISCSTAVHDQSLVAAAESMPRLPVPPVEPSGVSAQEPFLFRRPNSPAASPPPDESDCSSDNRHEPPIGPWHRFHPRSRRIKDDPDHRQRRLLEGPLD